LDTLAICGLLGDDQKVTENVEHGVENLALGISAHQGIDAQQPRQLIFGHGHLGPRVLFNEGLIGIFEAIFL
jgi:hypothetical protein